MAFFVVIVNPPQWIFFPLIFRGGERKRREIRREEKKREICEKHIHWLPPESAPTWGGD